MELLADRDPEEAREILDPVLELMMEAVHRYEGTVNQVMGDGIMALFGAPVAHEDHAVRACYAALRMQDSIRRYSEGVRRVEGIPIRIRAGLNSGEVVVRAIGSDLHMDYTAVGQTTHLAARMEQLAAPDTIALTAATFALVEGLIEAKSLGPTPVKGLAESVEVYEVIGAGTARTRLQAAARRGLTRFVGRDAEIEHLRRVLGQAGAGHGQVAAIVGEAGVGKSRLTYEFTHSPRVQDWLILEASSVSYGKATSYLAVIDLLKGYFKIGDRDDHRDMRAKVLGRVLGLDRALEPLLSPLLALLDVPVDDAAWQSLDPPQRRQRTLDAVKRLLLRESQVQPLLMVFEDLHWIDGETQALLDSLVDSLGSARLLLLVNYRPEYQHGWGSKAAYSQMRLDALPTESAGELLDELLGDDPGLAPLKQLLVKRGNPFFLEETIRTLVETKALDGHAAGIGSRNRPRRSGSRPRSRRCWRHASTDCPRRTSTCFRRLRSSARTCRGRCSRRSSSCRRRPCVAGSTACRQPSSSTRLSCFQNLSIPSNTRSLTRSPTAACCRSAAASSTRGSWMRSRRSTASASASTLSGWPITRCAAGCGRKRCSICGSPDSRRPRGRRSLTHGRGLSRRSTHSRRCLRASPR
jgi:class 3 adenylate cyclase